MGSSLAKQLLRTCMHMQCSAHEYMEIHTYVRHNVAAHCYVGSQGMECFALPSRLSSQEAVHVSEGLHVHACTCRRCIPPSPPLPLLCQLVPPCDSAHLRWRAAAPGASGHDARRGHQALRGRAAVLGQRKRRRGRRGQACTRQRVPERRHVERAPPRQRHRLQWPGGQARRHTRRRHAGRGPAP